MVMKRDRGIFSAIRRAARRRHPSAAPSLFPETPGDPDLIRLSAVLPLIEAFEESDAFTEDEWATWHRWFNGRCAAVAAPHPIDELALPASTWLDLIANTMVSVLEAKVRRVLEPSDAD